VCLASSTDTEDGRRAGLGWPFWVAGKHFYTNHSAKLPSSQYSNYNARKL